MSTDDRDDRAASFDRAAAVYQATRPSYPDDAVRWSVPAQARDVLDLAAGTGKLTERLVALGWHVVAVEPSDAMRAELTAALPAVEAFPGTAERMSLPDASVDAVTIAQAWHWVDPPAASAEIARVLRPGGQVAADLERARRGDRLGGAVDGDRAPRATAWRPATATPSSATRSPSPSTPRSTGRSGCAPPTCAPSPRAAAT